MDEQRVRVEKAGTGKTTTVEEDATIRFVGRSREIRTILGEQCQAVPAVLVFLMSAITNPRLRRKLTGVDGDGRARGGATSPTLAPVCSTTSPTGSATAARAVD